MKKTLLFLVLSASFFFTKCAKEDDPIPQQQENTIDCTASASPCELAEANNAFGFSVFQKLHEAQPNENIFISPLSISTALTMTMNGAAGETRKAMQKTLELNDWQLENVNAAYEALLNGLPVLDDEVRLQLAQSIWYKEGYPITESFLTTNEEKYKSEVTELDFSRPDAKDRINGWVNQNTNGLIKTILDEIPEDIVLYLINAIYFKGNWTHPFNADYTYDQIFYKADGTEEEVKMMNHPTISLPFMQTEVFTAVDMPYGDSIYSMSVLVPKEGYSVNAVIAELSTQNWNTWVHQFEPTRIIVGVPKFKMAYEKTLNKVLADLGMGIAFTDGADFSGITPGGGLAISEVRHKSLIEVDEKGSEAAAVTIIGVVETSVPIIPTVIANKPFLFVIRENKTNSVLFVGKMMNPNV